MSTVQQADSGSERERRRLARQLIIGTELISAELPPDNFGLIIDLTEDGAAIQAVAPLAPGLRRLFRCNLPPEREPLELTAEIVWSRKNKEAGLRFINPSEQARAKIRKVLQLLAVDEPLVADQPAAVEIDEFAPDSRPCQTENLAIERALARKDQFEALLRRAVNATHATGVAIAVLSECQFVCRASFGCAPGVGVLIQRESGLSAESISTGAVVCCADTDKDSRVNPEVCRELGMGSAVIVPVIHNGKVVALLECFWNIPHAYDETSLNELYGIAESLLAVLESRFRDAQSENISGPVGYSEAREPSPSAILRQRVSEFSVIEPGHPATTVADEVGDDETAADHAPFDGEEAVDQPTAIAADIQALSDELALRQLSIPQVSVSVLIGLAVFVLVTIPAVWYLWHRSESPVSPQTQVATAQLIVEPENTPVNSVELPALSSDAIQKSPSGKSDSASAAIGGSRRRSVIVTILTFRPRTGGDFQPLRLIHERSIPESAVRVTGTASRGGDQVRGGGSPASSSADNNPRSSYRRGTVVLDVSVAKDGAVEQVHVVGGDPLLAEAAKAAVTHWRYQPASVDGSPVQGNARVTVRFRSSESER